MNWTKVSAAAEIISSLAILITLLYLVVEIGQNTTSLQANARQEILDQDADFLMSRVNNPKLARLPDKPDLTDDEIQQLANHTLVFVRMRENAWLQYKSGALDEATWASYRRAIPNVLHNQRMRTWWQRAVVDREVLDPGFIAMVNELLSNEPLRETSGDLDLFD